MKYSKIFYYLLAIALAGCGNIYELNDSVAQTTDEMVGVFTAPVLAGTPGPSGCEKRDARCKQLDEFEARGFELARTKKITWTNYVNSFYSKRTELFPKTNDGPNTRELISYQRALAEQMDLKKLTETQWTYLVDKKYAELRARALVK